MDDRSGYNILISFLFYLEDVLITYYYGNGIDIKVMRTKPWLFTSIKKIITE